MQRPARGFRFRNFDGVDRRDGCGRKEYRVLKTRAARPWWSEVHGWFDRRHLGADGE